MNLSNVFRRLILAEIEALPTARTGRPQAISTTLALDHIFKVLRTGMQWREVEAPVSYSTIFRRFQVWTSAHIFRRAYGRRRRVLVVARCVVRAKKWMKPDVPRWPNGQRLKKKPNERSGFPCVGCAVVKTKNAQSTTTATTTLLSTSVFDSRPCFGRICMRPRTRTRLSTPTMSTLRFRH